MNQQETETTARVFHPAYKDSDKNIVTTLNLWRVSKKVSLSALARMARVSSGTVSSILSGSYPASPTAHLFALKQAMEAMDAAPETEAAPVQTSVMKRGLALFRRARKERGFTVFSGAVGVGKTTVIRAYAAATANTFVIDATPLMTLQILIKKLARLVIGEARGNAAQIYDDIIARLAGTDSFVIVDEAETLSDKQLHMIRRIADIANIGVALVGTPHLRALIGRENGQFDQIRSRTGFWPAALSGISREDADAFFAQAFPGEAIDPAVIERAFRYARGSARMLGRQLLPALAETRGERALSVALVDAVATGGLGLSRIGGDEK